MNKDAFFKQDPKAVVEGWTSKIIFRESHYSGRGPTTSDLNSGILEEIYKGIQKDVGKEEATNFVRFVNLLNDLSASSFIVAFRKFFYSGFKNTGVEQSLIDNFAIDKNDEGELDQAQIFATESHMPSLLNNTKSGVNDINSANIKAAFIENHKKEIPEAEIKKAPSYTFSNCTFYRFKKAPSYTFRNCTFYRF